MFLNISCSVCVILIECIFSRFLPLMFPEFLMMAWVTGVSSGTELHNFAFLLIVVFCNNLIVVGIQLLHLHLNVRYASYNLK